MGPKLISKRSKKSGILYSVRAFPMGGFASMAGEDEESDDVNALNRKPVWQRMVITVAGAAMNLIIGFILMTVVVITSTSIGGTTILRFAEDNVKKVIPSYNRGHFGHSIGCNLFCEEYPMINPAETRTFEPGMVLCVEIPYYSSFNNSYNIEDTILITENGVDRFTKSNEDIFWK